MISERIYAREESPEPAPIEGTSPLLELTKREDPKWKSALSYERLGPGRLALAGKLDGRNVRISLRLDAKPISCSSTAASTGSTNTRSTGDAGKTLKKCR